MKPDDDLVRRINEKDPVAFDELLKRFDWLIRHVAISMLFIRKAPRVAEIEADDVIQEVCAALWEKGIRKKIYVSLAAYLVGVTRHKALDRLPKVEGDVQPDSLEDVLPDPRPNPESQAYSKELSASLRKRILKIAPRYRQILYLYLDDLSEKEIAEQLGISVSRMKTRLFRAKKELLKTFELRN